MVTNGVAELKVKAGVTLTDANVGTHEVYAMVTRRHGRDWAANADDHDRRHQQCADACHHQRGEIAEGAMGGDVVGVLDVRRIRMRWDTLSFRMVDDTNTDLPNGDDLFEIVVTNGVAELKVKAGYYADRWRMWARTRSRRDGH